MATTFRFKKDIFFGHPFFNKDHCRIEFNSNEREGTLDLALYLSEHDATPNSSQGSVTLGSGTLTPAQQAAAFIRSNGSIGVILNEDKSQGRGQLIFLEKISKNTQNEAIYQTSIPWDDFQLKDNIINFYFLPDGTAASFHVDNGFASLTGFIESTSDAVTVKLDRPGGANTNDMVLWNAIKGKGIRFDQYEKFIKKILCADDNGTTYNGGTYNRGAAKQRSPFIASEEYNLIKFATEFFMLAKSGINTRDLKGYASSGGKLPYYEFVINRIEDDLISEYFENPNDGDKLRDCVNRGTNRLEHIFLIELIWSYWMEQGMLVQSMNVINLRFQNIANDYTSQALMRFDTDPLRPLSHILWGYIQDEQHRLSIPRRVNEYDHEYGLILTGRAVPRVNGVDSRSKFLEAFHNLLTTTAQFFRESDDTTRIADAFPVLNSLKEVHLLLAEGNHNAYGNLTWTARQEMLMQQYVLSRPEMREFLGGRVMVPYPETWMDRIDSMRSVQGWGDTSIIHFYELAIHGEQLLLSIRYGNWSDVNLSSDNAANWAKAFRNGLQRYIHAYRVVTGVDLSADGVDRQSQAERYAQPALLIQKRVSQERSKVKRA
jgi:hypothetical protein